MSQKSTLGFIQGKLVKMENRKGLEGAFPITAGYMKGSGKWAFRMDMDVISVSTLSPTKAICFKTTSMALVKW